jgi:tetratricopeptide (TPR) repeat protein
VFWVHAGTETRFREAYGVIADWLELPGRQDPKADVLRLVSNWLCNEANGKWVMILDNADDIDVFYPPHAQGESSKITPLASYLPQSHNGSFLLTSRSKGAAARLSGGYKNIKEVSAMNDSQGLQLFRNKLENVSNEEGAADLLLALDYIPLAITQAAAYINRRERITAAGYLDEFLRNDKKKESLLNQDIGDLRRDDSASNSVVSTWQLSFERIRQERRSAANLLSLMSFFNPQAIPEWVLRENPTYANNGDAEDDFDDNLHTLLEYSLVSVTADGKLLSLHPLVQFCTRVWLSSFGEVETWKQEFLLLMAQEFPTGDYENWPKCEELLPHVESVRDSNPTSDEALVPWAQVLTHVGWYLLRKGNYNAAYDVSSKAVAAREKLYGRGDELTMTSVIILADVLLNQGEYHEAEMLNRRALEGDEKGGMDKDNPIKLTSISLLADVLGYRGKYEEAEVLSRRALKGRQRELGPHHRDTLTSFNNLALILRYQGKYEKAEELHRRALEGYEKELGKDHPFTVRNIALLAEALRYQGKYDEAEELNRKALKGFEQELGLEHPDTLISVGNLALVLQAQGKYYGALGKYDEAERLSRRVLEWRSRELGKDHPDTLTSFYCLATLLHDQQRYAEATELYQKACDGRKWKLGRQHPYTIACLNDFRSMKQEMGLSLSSESLDLDVVEPPSPTTLHSTPSIATSSRVSIATGSSKQKAEKDTIYARFKRKMRR